MVKADGGRRALKGKQHVVRRIEGKWRLTEDFKLFLLMIPVLALEFVFSYLPLAGWRYAFYYYRPGFPPNRCEFVGLKWFHTLFGNSCQFSEIMRVLKNTIGISLLNMATSVFPVIFAIFLSEMKSLKFRKLVQITTTLPNFISWVLAAGIQHAAGVAVNPAQQLVLKARPALGMVADEGYAVPEHILHTQDVYALDMGAHIREFLLANLPVAGVTIAGGVVGGMPAVVQNDRFHTQLPGQGALPLEGVCRNSLMKVVPG